MILFNIYLNYDIHRFLRLTIFIDNILFFEAYFYLQC